MRLHALRVRAFGPFAGEETVDFDCLSGAGLFLLHGPTGAGKTSVLDAVCFALYGRVPGDRSKVLGGLRSDHAAPEVAPEVGCVFSVGPRRFEVTRSPQWERPKKRGSGTVTEQARVRLCEFVDGEPVSLATRLDEAGDLMQQLLGLGVDQFTKLILLPQGDFAAFLRSDAETRRKLLEKLFATDRFTAVQRWLNDRRQEEWRRVSDSRAGTAALLARAGQAVTPLGVLPDVPSAALATLDDVDALVVAVGEVLGDARTTRDQDARRRAVAQERYSSAAELAKHQAAFDGLTRRREQLLREAPQQRSMADRHRAGRSARTLAPLIAELRQARAALDSAQTRLASLDPEPLPEEELAEHVHRLTRSLGDLDSVEADARDLDEKAGAAANLDVLVAAVRDAITVDGSGLHRLTRQAADVADRLGAARVIAAQEADRERVLASARARLAAARSRDRLLPQVATAAELVRELKGVQLTARELLLELREARIEGMAAELAHALVVGEPCRVCGSPKHPLPAAAHERRISEAEEAQARAAVDAAETGLAAAADKHAGLSATLVTQETLADGVTRGDAERAADEAASALKAARDAGTSASELEVLAQSLARQAAECRRRTEELQPQLDAAVLELAELRCTIAGLTERIDRARGDHPTVSDRRAAITRELERCTRLEKLRGEVSQSQRRVDHAEPSARAAAAAAGFPSLDTAAEALIEDDELERLELRIAEYDRDLAAVGDRLTDPDLIAAALPPAEVDAAAAEREVADVAHEASTRRLTLAESAARELADLRDQLAQHLDVSAGFEAEYALVDGLSRCADGSGGDNAMRMSLSSYVLAARLEQVAGAASERLSRMSGGRYALVHTDERERGGARSGLGLRVLDGWTGRQRETATLSGGETFYASLALALGMADVVTQEAGGLSLETLFIDEGFGSLDEDTLEEVLDVLDDLRSGGRVVGLVSHVPDLRTRLPQRLEVVKGRSGSRVRQTAI